MTAISDLLDVDDLEQAIAEKLIRRSFHPDDADMAILNYTAAAEAARAWTPVVRACRGLMYRPSSGVVLARPWEKFFNHGEPDAPVWAPDTHVYCHDKADGALGILYTAPDGRPAVATRGSFTSRQAVWATEFLRRRWPDYEPRWGFTLMVEIISPLSRIIVDYGDREDLILLGGRDNSSGLTLTSWDADPRWPGTHVRCLRGVRTLAEALALPARDNAEGVVLYSPARGELLKLKQPDYVAVARRIRGVSARSVWKAMGEGSTADGLAEGLPAEIAAWIRGVAAGLERDAAELLEAGRRELKEVLDVLPEQHTQAEFAAVAADRPLAWLLFALRNGSDVRSRLWKNVKPAAGLRPHNHTTGEAE